MQPARQKAEEFFNAAGVDVQLSAAASTRRDLLAGAAAAAEKMMVQGFHYPFPSVAHVEKAGNGYREIPVMWNASL